jgi:hypothetical protein
MVATWLGVAPAFYVPRRAGGQSWWVATPAWTEAREPCPARKYDSAGDLQAVRASGGMRVLGDQAARAGEQRCCAEKIQRSKASAQVDRICYDRSSTATLVA